LPDILRDEQLQALPPKPPPAPSTEVRPEPEQQEEPTVVLTIVFFGANDAAIAGLDNHHHVPLDEYQDNLRTIVDIVQRETQCRRFLLVTPPPVHHEQRLHFQIEKYGQGGATGVLERTLQNTGRYAQACRQVASALQIPCLDLYHDMQHQQTTTSKDDEDDWGRFFYDGLHFSKQGHDFVGTALVQAIHEAAAFGDELRVVADARTGQWCNSASVCPLALKNGGGSGASGGGPYHDEIDATDPDRAFFEYHHHHHHRHQG
jgi:lysophospholipase L1-like esterase